MKSQKKNVNIWKIFRKMHVEESIFYRIAACKAHLG